MLKTEATMVDVSDASLFKIFHEESKSSEEIYQT